MSDKTMVRSPPALNPEQMAIVQPWKDYISLGLIAKLSAAFTPGGTSVFIDLSEAIPDSVTKNRVGLAPGQAKQFIIASGLAPKRGDKAKGAKPEEPLPVRTLTGKDLKKPENLPLRFKQVANKLGPQTALGRIGSLKMQIESANNFEEWWIQAKPEQKLRLVMDQKHFEELTSEDAEAFLKFVGSAQCPFRGSLPTNSQNNETKEEKPQTEGKQSPQKPSGSKGKAPAKK